MKAFSISAAAPSASPRSVTNRGPAAVAPTAALRKFESAAWRLRWIEKSTYKLFGSIHGRLNASPSPPAHTCPRPPRCLPPLPLPFHRSGTTCLLSVRLFVRLPVCPLSPPAVCLSGAATLPFQTSLCLERRPRMTDAAEASPWSSGRAGFIYES